MRQAVEAAVSGSWTVGLDKESIQREIERALGDPRERLIQEQSTDGRNPSQAMLLRRARAPSGRVAQRAKPRGGVMTRAAAEGQYVDAFADFWLRATDLAVQLGYKRPVPSKKAETRARIVDFRREQALGLAHGVRSTSDEHGMMIAEEGFTAVHPRAAKSPRHRKAPPPELRSAAGGNKGGDVATVLCCKERGRQKPRVRV